MKQQPLTPAPLRKLTRRARQRRKGGGPAPAADLLADLLAALGGGPEHARLSLLWKNWGQVMGAELAPLALPLGHHKGILLLGAEDAMLVQELHLMSGEILERVNAFMEKPFFSSVKVTLVLGKNILGAGAQPSPAKMPDQKTRADARPPARPARPSGSFLAGMDPASPVARCYARFVGKQTGKTPQKNARQERNKPEERTRTDFSDN